MEKFKLQFIGSMNYKLFLPNSKIFHPQMGAAMTLLELKRNDSRVLNAIVRDNFGRAMNLHGSNIKFVMRSKNAILGPDEEDVVVADQEVVEILDQLKYQNLGEFHFLLDEEATKCAGEFRAEFQIYLKGISQNKKIPPYKLADEMELLVKVDGLEQVVTFKQQNFSNITEATVSEVIAQINSDLTGATAYALQINEDSCYLFISSDSDKGSIQISGGIAAEVLGFSNQIYKDQKVTLPTETLLVVIKEDLDEKEEVD